MGIEYMQLEGTPKVAGNMIGAKIFCLLASVAVVRQMMYVERRPQQHTGTFS